MPHSLDILLDDLTCEIEHERQNAAYILMFLMEIAANEHCESLIASNRELLPDDWKFVVLTEQDQKKVIGKLYVSLRHVPKGETASLIYLMGKGTQGLVFEPFVNAIHELFDSFDTEEAAQAISGLHNMVWRDPFNNLFVKHVDLLRQGRIEAFLTRWNIESINSRFDVDAVIAHVREALRSTGTERR